MFLSYRNRDSGESLTGSCTSKLIQNFLMLKGSIVLVCFNQSIDIIEIDLLALVAGPTTFALYYWVGPKM